MAAHRDTKFAAEFLTKNNHSMKKSILSALMLVAGMLGAFAQNVTVHGLVVSKSDNEPLIGATVFSEATKAGTSTDIDGNFQLTVPEGTMLKVSYIGYATTEVAA